MNIPYQYVFQANVDFPASSLPTNNILITDN